MVNGIDVSHQYVLNLIQLRFIKSFYLFHFRSTHNRRENLMKNIFKLEYSFPNGVSLIEHWHLYLTLIKMLIISHRYIDYIYRIIISELAHLSHSLPFDSFNKRSEKQKTKTHTQQIYDRSNLPPKM